MAVQAAPTATVMPAIIIHGIALGAAIAGTIIPGIIIMGIDTSDHPLNVTTLTGIIEYAGSKAAGYSCQSTCSLAFLPYAICYQSWNVSRFTATYVPAQRTAIIKLPLIFQNILDNVNKAALLL